MDTLLYLPKQQPEDGTGTPVHTSLISDIQMFTFECETKLSRIHQVPRDKIVNLSSDFQVWKHHISKSAAQLNMAAAGGCWDVIITCCWSELLRGITAEWRMKSVFGAGLSVSCLPISLVLHQMRLKNRTWPWGHLTTCSTSLFTTCIVHMVLDDLPLLINDPACVFVSTRLPQKMQTLAH